MIGMKYKIIVLLLIFILGMYMDKIYNEEESNNKIEKIYECDYLRVINSKKYNYGYKRIYFQKHGNTS